MQDSDELIVLRGFDQDELGTSTVGRPRPKERDSTDY